jgi:hypothetical protein
MADFQFLTDSEYIAKFSLKRLSEKMEAACFQTVSSTSLFIGQSACFKAL